MSEFPMDALAATAVTQGVSFFYRQAGDLLRWWRESSRHHEGVGSAPTDVPTMSVPGELFEAAPAAPLPGRAEELQAVADDLTRLRRDLHSYADGTDLVDTSSRATMAMVEELRSALERVYGHPLRFREPDEDGPAAPSAAQHGGVRVGGDIRKSTVAGGNITF